MSKHKLVNLFYTLGECLPHKDDLFDRIKTTMNRADNLEVATSLIEAEISDYRSTKKNLEKNSEAPKAESGIWKNSKIISFMMYLPVYLFISSGLMLIFVIIYYKAVETLFPTIDLKENDPINLFILIPFALYFLISGHISSYTSEYIYEKVIKNRLIQLITSILELLK